MIKANAHFVECGGVAYKSDLQQQSSIVYGDLDKIETIGADAK